MEVLKAMFAALMARGGNMPGQPSGHLPNLPDSEDQKATRRDRLVANHNIGLQRFIQDLHGEPSRPYSSNDTHMKPASEFPTPPAIDACAPIAIADLHPGVTHRGRVLRGKLLVKPLLLASLATLLEDEEGQVVRVFVYNMLPRNMEPLTGLHEGGRLLPEGRTVAIIEPFYKIMEDGMSGVRVDNPAEVLLLQSLSPPDAAALQADGERHLQAAQYEEAAECFARALQRMPDSDGSGSRLLLAGLLNLSATHLKLGEAAQALQCASAAAALQPDTSRAHHLAALALARLGAPLAARCAVHQAFECMPVGGPGRKERRRMLTELEQHHLQQQERADVQAPLNPQQLSEGRMELLRLLSKTATLGLQSAATGPSASSSNTGAAAAALVEAAAQERSGDAAFLSGDVPTARSHYHAAAGALLTWLPAAPLLTHLATCHLQRSRPKQALTAATAAACLDPAAAEAHHTRVQALMQLGWLAEARAACTAGLAAVEQGQGCEALRELQERIRTASKAKKAAAGQASSAAAAANGGKGGGGGAGSSSRSSRNKKESCGSDHDDSTPPEMRKASVESVWTSNTLADLTKRFPGVTKGMPRLKQEHPLAWMALQKDDRVAPFHEEFSKAGRWPALCDMERCGRKLWEAYELCRSMNMHFYAMAVPKGLDPVEVAMMRIGDLEMMEERLNWLIRAPEGTVAFRECRAPGINPAEFHSFNNAQSATIPMPPGAPAGSGNAAAGLTSSGSNSRGGTTAALPADGAGAPGSGPRTHVAVGFGDLGSLAAAVGLPEWDPQVEAAVREVVEAARSGAAGGGGGGSSSSPAAPQLLRWVGYEASAYTVAKTLVLERMLRSGGPAATDYVLQVWFSSVWSREAHAAFRRALTELMREQQQQQQGVPGAGAGVGARGAAQEQHLQQVPAEVLPYLRHWQLRDVGLADSRQRWLDGRKRTLGLVGGFKEKSDRLALCEYLLTGQLSQLLSGAGGGGRAGGELVGSVVMFVVPRGGPERARDESFLEAIPTHELFAARLGSGGDSTGCKAASGGQQAQPDVVSAGVALLRRRVRRLAALLATGRVQVQLHLRAVEPGDSATAASISSLLPASISWSNVPDYYHPREFHAMARACSAPCSIPAPPTVHYMHSMNWVMDVKGASHLDMLLEYKLGGTWREQQRAAERSQVPEMPKDLSQRVLALYVMGRRTAHESISRYGTLLMSDPPLDIPRNVADFGLILEHYEAWVNTFLAAGGLWQQSAASQQAVVTARPTYGPVARSNTTFSMKIVYGS
ncbi:hypothetical protein Agub_g9242 [Astrephomene gubernaculifera]|uniref:Uncharacterized protein n=1 Tax=Astrephomene gubernaculifera TaxID=47775 RepID=A0AAD3HN42_9CHLO|nr:hypothetical protein Agub_g9242 [Astrephomene gubernaculifera]